MIIDKSRIVLQQLGGSVNNTPPLYRRFTGHYNWING